MALQGAVHSGSPGLPQPGPMQLPCWAMLGEDNEPKEPLPSAPGLATFHRKGENFSRSLPRIAFLMDDG